MGPLSMSAEGIFFLNPAVKKKASRELLSKLLTYPFLILLVITAAYVPHKQKVVFSIYYVYWIYLHLLESLYRFLTPSFQAHISLKEALLKQRWSLVRTGPSKLSTHERSNISCTRSYTDIGISFWNNAVGLTSRNPRLLLVLLYCRTFEACWCVFTLDAKSRNKLCFSGQALIAQCYVAQEFARNLTLLWVWRSRESDPISFPIGPISTP